MEDHTIGLFTLPIPVIIAIISNYLTVKDVSSLDIACNNHFSRVNLLKCFRSDEFAVAEIGGEFSSKKEYINWLIRRQIKVLQFDCCFEKLPIEQLSKSKIFKRLETLNYRYSRDNAMILDQCKTTLKSFTHGRSFDGNPTQYNILLEIIISCRSLETLCIDCDIQPPSSEITDQKDMLMIHTSLRKITFSRWDVSEAVITTLLRSCESLHALHLHRCMMVSRPTIEILAKQHSSLTELDVGFCEQLTDLDFQLLTVNCRQLRRLNISSCPYLTDQTIQCLASNCPSLQFMDMSNCRSLSDTALQYMGEYCHQLQQLDMKYAYNLTSRGLSYLTEQPLTELRFTLDDIDHPEAFRAFFQRQTSLHVLDCSSSELNSEALSYILSSIHWNLKHLDVSDCPALEDHVFQLLFNSIQASSDYTSYSSKPSQLVSLNLSGCTKISDKSIKMFSRMIQNRKFPHLISLDIRGCDQISSSSIQFLMEAITDCHNHKVSTNTTTTTTTTTTIATTTTTVSSGTHAAKSVTVKRFKLELSVNDSITPKFLNVLNTMYKDIDIVCLSSAMRYM